jgi:myo-inositol-1(or 4)-monophosphatase
MNAIELLTTCEQLIQDSLPQVLGSRYDIAYKPDGSPVTKSDIYLEKVIRNYLTSQIPDLTFVGEESFDFTWEENKGYLAILDPIDGTENFCSGLKEWGVSLGLWYGEEHLASMLLMPELQECIKTGDLIQPRFSRITGFSSSYNQMIGEGIKEAIEYRVTGCAVYNLFNVIRGSFARFVNPKGAYVWDLLPGIMLAHEHSCQISLNDHAYGGQLLDPTKKYRVDISHTHN